MHPSAVPTMDDIGGLFWYLVNNPYLFVSSSTVMTTGLLIGAVAVSVLPKRLGVLHAIAPTLAVILAYFGVGAFVLSVEILLRFHSSIPYETEVQLVSGIGHLVEALIGIAILTPHLRRHPAADWVRAHTAALAYWTAHITLLTPPWFSFQGQRQLVTTAALVLLAVAAAVNIVLWGRLGRR